MISERRIKWWLLQVRKGKKAPQEFIDELKRLPFDDVGIARVDTHRRLRRGLPEVIFSEGKSPRQLIQIVRRLIIARELVLLTRLDPCAFEEIQSAVPNLRYDPISHIAYK